MTATLTAFNWVPPFAQGYVRDLRIRWALEEAGLPYRIELVDGPKLRSAEFLRWQPFAQVPAYRDDEVEMFESGAILLHLAGKSEALAPSDPDGQAKVASWVLAALNSIEPHTAMFTNLDTFYAGQAWAAEYRPQAEKMVVSRLTALSEFLGDQDYIVGGRFTAGDLMVAMVTRELVDSGMLARFPNLDAHRARCEARPAFQKSLADQLQTFKENEPA